MKTLLPFAVPAASGTQKRLLRFAVVLLLLTTAVTSSFASHFRYGSMGWKTISGRTVEFKLKEAWRYDSYGGNPAPAVGNMIQVDDVLYFGDGSNTSDVTLTVTAIDPVAGYFFGEATYTHTYAADGNYTAYRQSCCRVSDLSNNADGDWRFETAVTVGNGNSSPVSSLPIIVNLPPGVANASFNVPANDPDGNPLTYRIATSGETAASPLADLTVSASGVATFNTVGKSVGQIWNGAITIEDNQGAKIVVDFLIRITTSTNPPTFDYTVTPANSSVIQTNVGQAVNFTVKATDSDAGDVVLLQGIGVPPGATFTPGAAANPVQASFSWTPGAGDVGSVVINFTATDNQGGQTSTSVTIQVNQNACNVAAPNLFTAYGPNQPVPPGQTSASVCQNSGNVTFQFDNCIGGTVNWSGTNGSNGTGSIVATSATVGTVTYSATCTIGQCISAASQVTVTVTALPTVTPGPNKSVVFTPTPGSNCTLISAQGNGGAGNYTYNWTSSNPNELPFTGQNPQVCPTVTTVYTVKATDANGCTSAPAQVTVTVKDVRCGPNNQNVTICYYGVTQCVTQSLATRYMKLGATLGSCGSARIGVEEKAAEAVLELSVKAYPNPTTGALTVQVNSPAAGIAQLDVLDVAGRAVQQRSHQLSEGLNEVEFNLSSQVQGTYLIRCRDVLGRQAVVRVQKQ